MVLAAAGEEGGCDIRKGGGGRSAEGIPRDCFWTIWFDLRVLFLMHGRATWHARYMYRAPFMGVRYNSSTIDTCFFVVLEELVHWTTRRKLQ